MDKFRNRKPRYTVDNMKWWTGQMLYLSTKQKVLSQDRIWKKCSFQIQNWIILICLIPGPMQVKGIVDASKVVLRTLLDEYLPGGGRISEAV